MAAIGFVFGFFAGEVIGMLLVAVLIVSKKEKADG